MKRKFMDLMQEATLYANERCGAFECCECPADRTSADCKEHFAVKYLEMNGVTLQKHGHWYFTEYEYFDCSVCGESYYNGCDTSEEAREKLKNGGAYPYCPNCGAKMDEANL